jgi:hypothetical protein
MLLGKGFPVCTQRKLVLANGLMSLSRACKRLWLGQVDSSMFIAAIAKGNKEMRFIQYSAFQTTEVNYKMYESECNYIRLAKVGY